MGSPSELLLPAEAPSLACPISSWGYEQVRQVAEVGSQTEGVKAGNVVQSTWGHRTPHIVSEEYAAQHFLPEGLVPIVGIFSHRGAIGLDGVHDAGLRIGETVGVFGLGPAGQIVAQLAKRSGAEAIGVDLVESRLSVARALKAIDVALNPREGSAA
jgi:NADPH-dependent curcumin reductase CurA